MQHVIKKQVLELKLVTGKDVFRMQQKAKEYYYHQILPAIEKVMNGLTDDGHIIQIDRLEIDLGAIQWEDGQQEMNMPNLYQKIEQPVKKAIEQLAHQQYLQGRERKEVHTIQKPVALHAGEQWLFYMRNGYLAWNITETSDAWYARVLEALATDYHIVSMLRAMVEKNENALLRIVNNHPVSFLVKLVTVLTAVQQEGLEQVMTAVEKLLYPGSGHFSQKQDNPTGKQACFLWQQLLVHVCGGLSSGDALRRLIKQAGFDESKDVSGTVKKQFPMLVPFISANSNAAAAIKNSVEPATAGFFYKRTNNNSNANYQTGETHNTADNSALPEEGIFAAHAGLVLLHPFFKSLFTHIGILTNGCFTGYAARERAIWLLHYIASGKTAGEEHQLAVPKILCGYPLDKSPETGLQLTSGEIAEAGDMMAAAIGQWSILKNTSAAGLREGFLQRSGKLSNKNDCLCFAVEPHAIDMLLDHLPWNLGIIKLPWIKEIIKVDWR